MEPDIERLKYYLLNFKGEFGGSMLTCMLDRRYDLLREVKFGPGHRLQARPPSKHQTRSVTGIGGQMGLVCADALAQFPASLQQSASV